MPSSFLLHLTLFVVALIYGLNYHIAKAIMPEYLEAFGIIVLRVWGASLLFILFLKSKNITFYIAKEDYRRLFLCAIFGVTANQLMFFKGLSLTSAVNASVLMTLTPILVYGFSAWAIKEKESWSKILGLFLGLSGALLLIGGKGIQIGSSTLAGDLLILSNAASYAVYLVLVKPLMLRYSALTVSFWIFLISCPLVLPFGLPELSLLEMSTFPTQVWLSIGFIIAGTTFLAYLLNAWALRFVHPALVGFYIYLQPVFAMLVDVLWAEKAFSVEKFCYSLLILCGILLVSRKS